MTIKKTNSEGKLEGILEKMIEKKYVFSNEAQLAIIKACSRETVNLFMKTYYPSV